MPIRIQDKRKLNPLTKRPINPNRDLKSQNFDPSLVKNLYNTARDYGIDPNLMLAVGLQESNLGKTDPNNPYRVNSLYHGIDDDLIAQGTAIFRDKYNKNPKASEAHRIQAYNGLTKKTRKSPDYGNQVISLRDSVIKQSPDLQGYMQKLDSAYNAYNTPMKKRPVTNNQNRMNPLQQALFGLGFVNGGEIESYVNQYMGDYSKNEQDSGGYDNMRTMLETKHGLSRKQAVEIMGRLQNVMQKAPSQFNGNLKKDNFIYQTPEDVANKNLRGRDARRGIDPSTLTPIQPFGYGQEQFKNGGITNQPTYNDSLQLWKAYQFQKANQLPSQAIKQFNLLPLYPNNKIGRRIDNFTDWFNDIQKNSARNDYKTVDELEKAYPNENNGKVAKYYNSLKFNVKPHNALHASPDLVHPLIAPTGSYFDGNALSPIYKKPVGNVPAKIQEQPIQQITPEAQTQINTGSSTPITLGMSSPDSSTGKRLYRYGNKDISEQEFNKYKSLGKHKIVEYADGGATNPLTQVPHEDDNLTNIDLERVRAIRNNKPINLSQYNFGGTLGTILSTASPFLNFIPGLGTAVAPIAGMVGQGLSAISQEQPQGMSPQRGYAGTQRNNYTNQGYSYGGNMKQLPGGMSVPMGNGVEALYGNMHSQGGIQVNPQAEAQHGETMLDKEYILTDKDYSNFENNKMSISKRFKRNTGAVSPRNSQEKINKAKEFLKQDAINTNEQYLMGLPSLQEYARGGQMYLNGGYADPTGNKDWTYDRTGDNWTGYKGGRSYPLSGNPKYQGSVDRLNASYNPMQPMNPVQPSGVNNQRVPQNQGRDFRFYQDLGNQLYSPVNTGNGAIDGSSYRGYPANPYQPNPTPERGIPYRYNDQGDDGSNPGSNFNLGNTLSTLGMAAPAIYNAARGIFEKPQTWDASKYMTPNVNPALLNTNVGQNEIKDAYTRSLYDMKNSGVYSKLGQVNLQNNRAKNDYERKLNISNQNAGIRNQTNATNANINARNNETKMRVQDINDRARANKHDFLGTALSQGSELIQNDRINKMNLGALDAMYENPEFQNYLASVGYKRKKRK